MVRRLWLRSAILMALLGYILASPELLLLAGLLAVAYAVAGGLNRGSLAAVRYFRHVLPRRAFAGETMACEIHVENRRRLPLLWLTTEDRWPNAVAPTTTHDLAPSHLPDQSELRLALSLRGRTRARRDYHLLARRRGIYSLGPAVARSTDPFALFRDDGVVAPAERLVIYPPIRPLAALGFQSDDPFGSRRAQRRLFDDASQPMGVRDYASGDSFRDIHWPATARTGMLQTRVYQPVAGLDMVVCLNAATYDRHWEGYDPERMEALVETAAALAVQALEAGHRVGLISNGSIARSGRPFRIPPGRAPGQLSLLLECLAGLTPIVKAPFGSYLLAQAPSLAYGSTLIVITALTPPSILEALVQLRAHGRRTRLVSLAKSAPPFLPGIPSTHLPPISGDHG
ncbi:MAG: DUF58 domain-containing protein [Anaerolineales bacterium]|nr:DUF58 domain-containing protein [Anaerolineales bacterium]